MTALLNPVTVVAAILTLIPFFAIAFFGESLATRARRLRQEVQLVLPALLAIPYILVAVSHGVFRWGWLLVYAVLPVAITGLLMRAAAVDPRSLETPERGTWRDFLVLTTVGLAVDLRWFETAWPPHLSVFSKMLLLDAGIYGFVLVRQLSGIGFSLRLRLSDLKIGLREFCFYAPIAIGLGLALGFLHRHGFSTFPGPLQLSGMFVYTLLFIALPEEIFFRGWMQNLLERRLGRYGALAVTAVLFGLAHFNKRAVHFNWRYVIMAALAGIFYGRAWRQQRRVGASAITHACVDTVWSACLR